MRRIAICGASVAVAGLLFVPGLSRPANNKVPAAFANATYVFVEAMDGNEFSPDLSPEDRDAILNVREALNKWGRYHVTLRRDEAQLIFLVRAGARVIANVGVGPSSRGGPSGTRNLGIRAGGEVGPAQDMLEVHIANTGGGLGTILWQRSEKGGLSAPEIPLLAELKNAVEHDYPPQPPKP